MGTANEQYLYAALHAAHFSSATCGSLQYLVGLIKLKFGMAPPNNSFGVPPPKLLKGMFTQVKVRGIAL